MTWVSKNLRRVKKRKIDVEVSAVLLAISLSFVLVLVVGVSAAPDGVSSVSYASNETKTATAGFNLSIAGGYIATVNLTASTQNLRWKGFVGNVTGTFTLDDAAGSTLYDWSLTSVAGEVYATRNSSTITWTQITCANTTILEDENSAMGHTNADDNITATFNSTGTHSEFFVGVINITVNRCPTLNTYNNSATQDTAFEEIALFDGVNETLGGNVIYATIMEDDLAGFDGGTYDFQMIVPENGTTGFSGATSYYLYVELS